MYSFSVVFPPLVETSLQLLQQKGKNINAFYVKFQIQNSSEHYCNIKNTNKKTGNNNLKTLIGAFNTKYSTQLKNLLKVLKFILFYYKI